MVYVECRCPPELKMRILKLHWDNRLVAVAVGHRQISLYLFFIFSQLRWGAIGHDPVSSLVLRPESHKVSNAAGRREADKGQTDNVTIPIFRRIFG